MKEVILKQMLKPFVEQLARLPDYRKGRNTTYTIADAALSAFSVFFMQSPSFLAHQRTVQGVAATHGQGQGQRPDPFRRPSDSQRQSDSESTGLA